MSDTRKKFWIKIERDFLNSSHIKVIKNMPNGKEYVLFYLALMLESIQTDGYLRFSELVPYNEEMLASITDTNVDTVRIAVKIFSSIGLIELLTDGTIYIPEVPMKTGNETVSAERMRLWRAAKKEIESNPKTAKKLNNFAKENNDFTREIIKYLNEKTGKMYKGSSDYTRRLVRARRNQGYKIDDFKTVIDKKTEQWKEDERMARYLRPETLFGTKFEAYLNELVVPKKPKTLNYSQREHKEEDILKLFTKLEDIEV